MKKVDIIITIDTNSRRIEFCQLEGINLPPGEHFRFVDGQWKAEFKNFQIGDDNDLDILIISVGNPNTDSAMHVKIGTADKGPFNLYKKFNRNGYGQFNQAIPL